MLYFLHEYKNEVLFMENNKKGINAKLIIIIAAVIAVIVAAFFGIRALIPEKTPVNDKSTETTPEVITLPGEDVK